MLRALLAALTLLWSSAAFAHDASLDYRLSDGGHYCEFRTGGPLPARLKPYKTWRQYPEGPNYYNLMRDYRACHGKVRVEILLDSGGIRNIDILEPGICAIDRMRKICVGETLALAHRRFPEMPMRELSEEGPVLDASLSPTASLLINDDSLNTNYAQRFCDVDLLAQSCFRVLGREKIRGIDLFRGVDR